MERFLSDYANEVDNDFVKEYTGGKEKLTTLQDVVDFADKASDKLSEIESKDVNDISADDVIGLKRSISRAKNAIKRLKGQGDIANEQDLIDKIDAIESRLSMYDSAIKPTEIAAKKNTVRSIIDAAGEFNDRVDKSGSGVKLDNDNTVLFSRSERDMIIKLNGLVSKALKQFVNMLSLSEIKIASTYENFNNEISSSAYEILIIMKRDNIEVIKTDALQRLLK